MLPETASEFGDANFNLIKICTISMKPQVRAPSVEQIADGLAAITFEVVINLSKKLNQRFLI
jgi:hypothetical protein